MQIRNNTSDFTTLRSVISLSALSVMLLAGCTKCSRVSARPVPPPVQVETNNAKSEKLVNNPCRAEIIKFCDKERGIATWKCLKSLPLDKQSAECRQYIAEFPAKNKALEDQFISDCKPFFVGCPNTDGDLDLNRMSRRQCITDKIKEVSPECKKSMDTHLKILPPEWRPKNWSP